MHREKVSRDVSQPLRGKKKRALSKPKEELILFLLFRCMFLWFGVFAFLKKKLNFLFFETFRVGQEHMLVSMPRG